MLKKILLLLVVLFFAVVVLGMYKFDYLASQPGHDVDGNPTAQPARP